MSERTRLSMAQRCSSSRGCSAAEAEASSSSSSSTMEDRISRLPDEVIHHILSFLEMKDAVGTSILSNRWRYLWTFNTNIDFPPLDHQPYSQQEHDYVNIINQCLRLHNRPNINRLQIDLQTVEKFSPDINAWITFAITRGVRRLLVRKRSSAMLGSDLPEIIFFHNPLIEWAAYSCIFELPPEFKGFPFLRILHLYTTSITNDDLTTLLLTCPILEELSLEFCHMLKNLTISAPNLSLKLLNVSFCGFMDSLLVNAPKLLSFTYKDSMYVKIQLENVPLLLKANVSILANLKNECVCGSSPLVATMANVESLTVQSWFTQFVYAEYCVSQAPHITFMNLKDFQWSGNLVSQYEVLSLSTFLGDCPSLQSLCIKVTNLANRRIDWYRDYHDKGVMGNHYLEHLDYSLHQLKTIVIEDFSGTKMEMDLIRFLFDKAIILDFFIVIPEPYTQLASTPLLLPLSCLPKRSPHVKIMFSIPHPSN